VVNSPVKLSRTPVQLTHGADRPGGHTRVVLKNELGFDEARIDELTAAGAISDGLNSDEGGNSE
jgi:crotonobetainyl-CoA:carnitine CoA-transferase CaiB-like acyl-CoA transferase